MLQAAAPALVRLLLQLQEAAVQPHQLLLRCRLRCLQQWLLLQLLLPAASAVPAGPCWLRWRWWLRWQCQAHGTAPQRPAVRTAACTTLTT
jgi:hypothetical protein